MDLREYIRTNLIHKKDRILEFGPLIRPLVSKKDFPNIFFADVRSTEDIKKLYTSNDYMEATGVTVDVNEVAEIDYVITKSYTETFKNEKKFDVIYLSHVIEHMPDIISFFQDIANVLKEKGKLILIYPDARYCFDHFRNGTTFVDAYDVHENNVSASNRVFDFVYNVVHENRPEFFWKDPGLSGALPKNNFNDALVAREKATQGELPDDTHFWPFADYQFVKFLYDMDRGGLLKFDISYFHETQPNTQEFMIVLTLKNKNRVNYKKYQAILSKISPLDSARILRKEVGDLEREVTRLNQTAAELRSELNNIYNSKRWRLAGMAADIRHGKIKLKK